MNFILGANLEVGICHCHKAAFTHFLVELSLVVSPYGKHIKYQDIDIHKFPFSNSVLCNKKAKNEKP